MTLSDALRFEPCDYRCTVCNRKACADQNPSPGEPHVCADCWDGEAA